jgi:SAM-dependent methyltransferase
MELGCLIRRLLNRIRYGGSQRLLRRRVELATKYIRGSGIEIGALHHPVELPLDAKVSYVDRFDNHQLRRQFPELQSEDFVSVDIIDDGETLNSIPDASVEFVICNHLLEHCQDPIGTVGNWLRVLKEEGVLFLSVPNKRYTFDCHRPVTDLDHFLQDWREGPTWSRMQHYEEWAIFVDRVPDADVMRRASALSQSDDSIHFHVWTLPTFRAFVRLCRAELDYGFDILELEQNGIEVIVILKRRHAHYFREVE